MNFVGPVSRRIWIFRSTSLKAHLRRADRLGALYTILLGDDEVAKEPRPSAICRRKHREDLPIQDLATAFRNRLLNK